MDNKSDDQLLIMKSTIDDSRQDSNERTKNITEVLTEIIASMMDRTKFLNTHQTRRIHQRLRILPLMSWIT